MEYDGTEWRAQRNAMLRDTLEDDQAVEFILLIMAIGEQWDDIVDGDLQAGPANISNLLWMAIVELQENPFYATHKEKLLPVLIVGMNAWMDSIALENGTRQEKATAYGLRDIYLEIISMTIFIKKGYDAMRQNSAWIRAFLMDTHDTIDEYLGEKT